MGPATAPTVSNNSKARIELEKKKKMGDWDWWQKVQDFELNEYGNKPVQGGEGCANSVLHCCSDNNHNGQKSWPGLEIQFLPNIPSASAHNWLRGPLWGSGWGFRAYIGMQSAHFRAIYSYI